MLGMRSLFKSAGVLVGGTAAAQLLTVLILPALTRLYSPEDFGVLASYAAVLAIAGSIACLRMELAILLPEDDDTAFSILVLSIITSFLFAGLIVLVMLLFGDVLFDLIGQHAFSGFRWLLPFGIWLMGTYSAIQYWATRKQRFSRIAVTRITQVLIGCSLQIGLGWSGIGAVGLLLGHTAISGAGAFNLIVQAVRVDRPDFKSLSWLKIKRVLSTYRQFPCVSVFETLSNTAGQQLPILFIAAWSGKAEAGFVLLAVKVLGAPLNMVGGAISQVYFSKAPIELREGRLSSFTYKTLLGVAVVGVPLILIVSFLSPYFFEIFFGEKWRAAGDMVLLMAPWFTLRLLASTISTVMHVKMLQKRMLSLTVFGLIIRILIILLVGFYLRDFLVESYAISGAIFYAIALYVFVRSSR